MNPLPPKVKFCRNFVACTGIFILAGSILVVLVTPAKWIDGLDMLAGALMCFAVVGEINRREGRWHQEAFTKKAFAKKSLPEPSLSSEESVNE